jgi:hypothetical protein
MPFSTSHMRLESSVGLLQNPRTLFSINLVGKKVHPTASRVRASEKQKRGADKRVYANSNNDSTITSFNISPPGDNNGLWTDDDVLEVPSLRDQLYPRSVGKIFLFYF